MGTIVFFTKDDEDSRGNMRVACILVIIGVSLVAIWATCYFVFLYKKANVTTGNDGVGFIKATRKQEVVITLYVACCIDALFAYFICVVSQYNKAMGDEEEKKEEDADKKSEKSKKSEKKDEAMGDMMEGM